MPAPLRPRLGRNEFMLCRREGEFSMYRRNLIVGAIASTCFGIRGATAWPLVTRQQVQRENAAPQGQAAPAPTRSGAPTISIQEPDITRPVRSPVNIRIRFQAAANARIEVNTLRVRYGRLGIDLTRRILAMQGQLRLVCSSKTPNFPEGGIE